MEINRGEARKSFLKSTRKGLTYEEQAEHAERVRQKLAEHKYGGHKSREEEKDNAR